MRFQDAINKARGYALYENEFITPNSGGYAFASPADSDATIVIVDTETYKKLRTEGY